MAEIPKGPVDFEEIDRLLNSLRRFKESAAASLLVAQVKLRCPDPETSREGMRIFGDVGEELSRVGAHLQRCGDALMTASDTVLSEQGSQGASEGS